MQKQAPMLRSRTTVGVPPPPPPMPRSASVPMNRSPVNVEDPQPSGTITPRRSSSPASTAPSSPNTPGSSYSSVATNYESYSSHVPTNITYARVNNAYPIKGQDAALSWRAFVMRGLCIMLVLTCTGHYLSSTFIFHLENAQSLSDDIFVNQESLLEELHSTKKDLSERYNNLLLEKKRLDQVVAHERSLVKKATDETLQVKQQYQGVKDNFQKMSSAMATEKFGPGPHFVEFEVQTWEMSKPKTRFFTIELAPLDVMPATVNTFLQQVSHGLWDGTSFHYNAEHIVGVRPVSGDGQVSRREDFEQSGVGNLLFKEYSNKYKHLPYTLGFTGLGPSFYINKMDNSQSHGAAGEPESCFGRVVIGRQNVDAISAMRGPDSDPRRIKPVDIKKVRILKHLSPKAHQEYLMNTR